MMKILYEKALNALSIKPFSCATRVGLRSCIQWIHADTRLCLTAIQMTTLVVKSLLHIKLSQQDSKYSFKDERLKINRGFDIMVLYLDQNM